MRRRVAVVRYAQENAENVKTVAIPPKSTAHQILSWVQRSVARRLFNLPTSVQARLLGGLAPEVDGQRLHPDMQLLLTTFRLRAGQVSLSASDIPTARTTMFEHATSYADAPTVGSVRDFTIDTNAGPLRMRHYAPDTSLGRGPLPLLVFLHGGGFVLCDLDTHDLPCRLLCRSASVHVLSVQYRLAPEYPFPAAIEDTLAALSFASEQAQTLGADPNRIAIGGDSAGGCLAAVAAHAFAHGKLPALKAQVLIYPATDHVGTWRSRELFKEGYLLTAQDIAWFTRLYADRVPLDDPRLSPLRTPDLREQCPAIVITAGFDPLRDEGEAYAQALREAGNVVVNWREPSLIHGFINFAGFSRESRRATKRIGEELRALLH